MRVLFATDHIHVPQGGGGGERNTHELSLALRARGVSPAVMCSLSADRSWMSLGNRLRRVVLPGQRFPRDGVCGYPVFRGWREDGTAEVARRFRPDAVIVQSTHPAPLIEGFSRQRLPVAAYVHEVAEIDHLSALAGTGVGILANSPFTARRLHEQCGLDATVILPLVDPAHYRVPTRPERVLFVNTVPRKGLEIALGLARARPDIGFDFVLSWILSEAQIASLRRAAEAAGNIVLHAPVRDMRPLYAGARVVLAPSQWEETWGRVATEAHVNAIPVLGSDRGGLPEAIGPGGLVVAWDAPIGDWAAALARLWDEPATYQAVSRAARAYGDRPEIQPGTIATKLTGVLAGMLAGTPAGTLAETLAGMREPAA